MRRTADITFLACVSRTRTFHSMSEVFAVALAASSGASTSWMGALRLSGLAVPSVKRFQHSLQYALDRSYHVLSVLFQRLKESRIAYQSGDPAVREPLFPCWHPPLVTLSACAEGTSKSVRRTRIAECTKKIVWRVCLPALLPRLLSRPLVMQLELARRPTGG